MREEKTRSETVVKTHDATFLSPGSTPLDVTRAPFCHSDNLRVLTTVCYLLVPLGLIPQARLTGGPPEPYVSPELVASYYKRHISLGW